MKFKMIDEHIYWWPVEVQIPEPDKPGKTVTQSFTMQFKAMGADAGTALLKEIEALPTPEERQARQHEELLRVCQNWRDVTDDKGEDVPFSAEALRSCLQFSWFSRGLYKAYWRSLAPDEARKGN